MPWPDAARDALVALLGAGRGALPVWDALEAAGFVSRWLPAWERVRHLPTRTPVHRHTVDRHLVETAVTAAGLARRVNRPDLLLLAALFHDLGKGLPGDHSESGAEIAQDLGHRVGLAPQDAATLARLVRHHLLLPQTATRRDPDDPATVEAVVSAVGSAENLDLLAALTEADATAAGPVAWSPMRARLVGDLVDLVRAVLGGAPPPKPERLQAWQEDLAVREPLAVRLERGDPPGTVLVTVVAPAAASTLATVAGVLALHRLGIRTATATTVGDRVVLVWRAVAEYGSPPAEVVLRDEIERALAGRLDVAARLEARARERRGRVIRHASPRVLVLPTASADATVVEVRAHDEPALLHRLAAAIFRCGVVVRSAVVETLGAEAVDVFYLVGADGSEPAAEDTGRVVDALTASIDPRR